MLSSVSTAHSPTAVQVVPDEAFHPVVIRTELAQTPVSPVIKASTPQPTRAPRHPTVVISGTGKSISGLTATWYCNHDRSRGQLSACARGFAGGMYAAISPDLSYLRGHRITVHYHGTSISVTIIDCNCQATHSLDLYADAFVRLAPLGAGRLYGLIIRG